MSNYIRCDQCGCDSLDTDTLHCSCGSDAPTSCAAAERFSADLGTQRGEVARLREALEQARRYATGQAFRILTDALAEGDGNPSQKL